MTLCSKKFAQTKLIQTVSWELKMVHYNLILCVAFWSKTESSPPHNQNQIPNSFPGEDQVPEIAKTPTISILKKKNSIRQVSDHSSTQFCTYNPLPLPSIYAISEFKSLTPALSNPQFRLHKRSNLTPILCTHACRSQAHPVPQSVLWSKPYCPKSQNSRSTQLRSEETLDNKQGKTSWEHTHYQKP